MLKLPYFCMVVFLDDKAELKGKAYMEKIFDNAKFYLEQIKNIRIKEERRKEIDGKSMITVWLTKLCPANCEHCFSKSNMHQNSELKEKYQFSDYGVKRLIDFINDSNNSYLMMSGGGEPMMHKEAVKTIIEKASTNRIVIVTNGIWAKSYENAEKTIAELYESYKKRKNFATVVLRLSVDKFHVESLGEELITNIIKVFKNKYSDKKGFKLLIHTIRGDDTIERIAKQLSNCEIIFNNEEAISDNKDIVKIMPKQALLRVDNFVVKIGYAKLFFPNLKPNLNVFNEEIESAIKVFDEDMQVSEFGNPSVVKNYDGRYGLDFWIEYNGNVTTWGNQHNDSLYNIYTDDYNTICKGTLNNIISYSFIDKGYYYRENIINEVNPKAVLRSKVMNLRNYTSASLLEEDKTKLYYAIRVIQDYLEEGILEQKEISILPANLLKLINSTVEEINIAYNNSKYDILMQSLENNLDKKEWESLFLLIKLGHYDIYPENLERAISEFNDRYFCQLENLDSFEDTDDYILYESIKERIAFMKKDAEKFCFMMH